MLRLPRGLMLERRAAGHSMRSLIDDTGFPKKGVHSVGVARQYSGRRLAAVDNCQIAVTLSIANHAASLPIAYRLYLPEDWAADEARRKKAACPGRRDIRDQATRSRSLRSGPPSRPASLRASC